MIDIHPKRAALFTAALLLTCAFASGQASGQDKKAEESKAPAAAAAPSGDASSGLAAFYDNRLHGHRTASGERYNAGAMTTAHQTYPFGTRLKVTHVKNNRSVIVRVNDRGPTQAGRVVDLSRAAASQLRMLREGLAEVRVEVVK